MGLSSRTEEQATSLETASSMAHKKTRRSGLTSHQRKYAAISRTCSELNVPAAARKRSVDIR